MHMQKDILIPMPEKEPQHTRPALFLHGGAPLEGLVRTRLKAMQVADKAMDSLRIPHQDHTKSDIAFEDMKIFTADMHRMGVPPERLEFVPNMLERDFHIRRYTEAANDRMTERAREGTLDILVGHSVGSLAALESVALRIDQATREGLAPNAIPNDRPDLALPKLIVLVDPLLGGLTPIAQTYLDYSKQSDPRHAVPGLLELYPNSDYLVALRAMLTAYSDQLPPIIVLDSQVGPGWVACPFAALPQERFAPIATKLGIPNVSTHDDGMGIAGIDSTTFTPGRFAIVTLQGLTHVETGKRMAPLLADIMKRNRIADTPVDTLLTSPPEQWPILDYRSFLDSPKNQKLGKVMELFFWGVAKSNKTTLMHSSHTP